MRLGKINANCGEGFQMFLSSMASLKSGRWVPTIAIVVDEVKGEVVMGLYFGY